MNNVIWLSMLAHALGMETAAHELYLMQVGSKVSPRIALYEQRPDHPTTEGPEAVTEVARYAEAKERGLEGEEIQRLRELGVKVSPPKLDYQPDNIS